MLSPNTSFIGSIQIISVSVVFSLHRKLVVGASTQPPRVGDITRVPLLDLSTRGRVRWPIQEDLSASIVVGDHKRTTVHADSPRMD